MSTEFNPNASNIRWADVRERVAADYEATRDALVTAKGDDVPRLQGKALALRGVIQWFERGALAERALTDDPRTPVEGY
jgi:hypothetical protein